jgi:hypothetical protein
VKTLAIRGTAEETMVARKNALKDRQEKLPKLIEEAGMRHYIAVRLTLLSTCMTHAVLESEVHQLPAGTFFYCGCAVTEEA